MTDYERHLALLIAEKRAGHPRNRSERRRQARVLRRAANYCLLAIRRNPASKVHDNMARDLRLAVG